MFENKLNKTKLPPNHTTLTETVKWETSAGGIVINNIDAPRKNQYVATIAKFDRKDKLIWTLPKGHLEAEENLETAALREIKEETGISGKIITKLGTISYWFNMNNTKIHKDVHHFLVKYSSGVLSDSDQEVAEVKWIPIAQMYKILAFPDEIKLLKYAERILAKHRRINLNYQLTEEFNKSNYLND